MFLRMSTASLDSVMAEVFYGAILLPLVIARRSMAISIGPDCMLGSPGSSTPQGDNASLASPRVQMTREVQQRVGRGALCP